MKKKVAIFIFSLALLVIAYQFFLGKPQSNNLQSDSTSSQAIAEASQSQPTFSRSLALTTGGEELLSFHYEGIGSDVIVRKNRTFIMRVYYGDKSDGKGYSYSFNILRQRACRMVWMVRLWIRSLRQPYYPLLKPRPV